MKAYTRTLEQGSGKGLKEGKMMNVNVPASIMHSLTHPDAVASAAANARSDRSAGRTTEEHWFVYWSKARSWDISGQKGSGLEALRAWVSKSLAPQRAGSKKAEAGESLGFPRGLSAVRDC